MWKLLQILLWVSEKERKNRMWKTSQYSLKQKVPVCFYLIVLPLLALPWQILLVFFFQVLFCFGNPSCADTRNHPGSAAKTITCHRRGSLSSRLQPSSRLAAKHNPTCKRCCCCSRTAEQKFNSLTFHSAAAVPLRRIGDISHRGQSSSSKCQ